MDEKYIKEIWRKERPASGKFREDVSDEFPCISDNGRKTALNRLADRYKHFLRIEIVFTFAIPGMVSGILHRNGHTPAVIIAFILFFLTAAAIDYYIYRKLCGISVERMTTSDVIRQAMDCRKLHLVSIIFLLPFALLCIGLLGWALSFEPGFMIGIGIGALIGTAIGIVHFLRFMSDYRQIGS